ncbi:MAG: alkaline shock response membrane anchor protein AmaP [Candidatus Omnitrophota bacterium]
MKILNIFLILIYTFLFSILGAILIALSIRLESFNVFVSLFDYLKSANNIRLGIGIAGLLIIFINISIAQLSLGKIQKEKTIAFDNTYGQVTVSLAAIEDYIKKLTSRISEIKEIRSSVIALKSGIEVNTRVSLYSGANIPEITEKIQNIIKMHLQEMLGIEEKPTIKIHVAKIVQQENPTKEQKTTKTPESGFKGEIEYGG